MTEVVDSDALDSPPPPESPTARLIREARGGLLQRLWRATVSTLAVLVGLALLGSLMGPRTEVQQVMEPLIPETELTAIGGASDRAPVGTYPVVAEIVSYEIAPGVEIQARIERPIGVTEPLPAVLFVHGAGTADHERSFVKVSHDLASTGIVTLVPDKRMDTYSTLDRDYVDMAEDYLVSFEYLRALDGVDSDRVGVYAVSEGAWIAPVMAAQEPDIHGLFLISAPVVKPRWQMAFAVDNYLRNTGVPDQVFFAIPRAVGVSLPSNVLSYIDFDVQPYQRQVTQPTFVAYGTADDSMPLVQGARLIMSDLSHARNFDVTVRYYADADHGLWVADDTHAPGYIQDLSDWFRNLPDTARAVPYVAGATPQQAYMAPQVAPSGWFSHVELVIAQIIVGLALVLLSPAALMIARPIQRRWQLRKDPDRQVRLPGIGPGMSTPAMVMGASSALAVVGLIFYLYFVARLALDYSRSPILVTVGWVIIRMLAVVSAAALAMYINRFLQVRALRREVPREEWGESGLWYVRGIAGFITLSLIAVGTVLLILTLAYWGVYQLGI